MGVQDNELRKNWGNDLTAVNIGREDPKAVNKLYAKLVRSADPEAPEPEKRIAISEAIQQMELDPEVTKRTLGEAHPNLSKEAILAITRKLLAVSRKEQDPRRPRSSGVPDAGRAGGYLRRANQEVPQSAATGVVESVSPRQPRQPAGWGVPGNRSIMR